MLSESTCPGEAGKHLLAVLKTEEIRVFASLRMTRLSTAARTCVVQVRGLPRRSPSKAAALHHERCGCLLFKRPAWTRRRVSERTLRYNNSYGPLLRTAHIATAAMYAPPADKDLGYILWLLGSRISKR